MKKTILICLQFSLLLISGKIISQTTPTNSSAVISPQGIFDIVFDRFGNQYPLANLNVHSSKPIGGPQNVSALPTSSCNAGYFTLWFIQNSICDLNANAKNRMCELFSNISGLLPSPLTTNSLQVNILCGDYTGTNNPLAEATSFYVFPWNPSNPNPGILENQAQKAIITGSDPYLNIPLSFIGATSFYCGAVYTNTNYAWDYTSTTTSVSPGTNDFYSVHLHEAMHILGILSLINYDGYSRFGQANNYFGTFDKFLVDNNGTHLITSSTPTSCPNTNVAFTTSLVSVIAPTTTGCVTDVSNCSTAIQYSSAVTQMTVYTPNCWESGSSLSHFEDNICPISGTVAATCYTANGNSKNNLYYVMSNASSAGDCYVKRFLKEEERKVLCDLGYTVNATYTSNIAVDGTFTSHPYSASACTPTAIVLGLNDGLVSGAYTFTTTTNAAVISYSTLTNNDLPTNGVTVTCLDLVYVNNATLTPGSGLTTFTVNANQSSGLVLLKYYPKNSSGQIGNVTYVYVYFIPANCNPSGMCNLINNGDFENSMNCGLLDQNHTNFLFGDPFTSCWVPVQGYTYLYASNCTYTANAFNLSSNNTLGTPPGTPLTTFSGSGNNHVLGLNWINSTNSSISSPGVIKNNLSAPIVPTHTYQVSFFANNYLNTSGTVHNNSPVVISLATSSVYAFLPSVPFPNGLDIIAEFTLNPGTNWSQLTHTFVFTPTASIGNQSALLIGINYAKTLSVPGSSWNPNSYQGYFPPIGIFCYIDNISLVEFPVPTFSIPNPTICGNQSFPNLAQYASTTGTFSGQGVTGTIGQQHFNLNGVMNPGIYPIAFTYSSTSNTCTNTIYQVVTVGSNTNFVALTPNPINLCLSNATINPFSLLTNTNLTTTTFSVAGAQISSPYTFSVAGQYTLSASNTSTALCSNSIYTTLVNVYDSYAPWFTEGIYTVGSATICSGNTYAATANSSNTQFLWQPGNLVGSTQVLNPLVTTVFTVSAFDYSLCVSSSTFAVVIATNCCNGSTLTPFTGTATPSSTLYTGSLLISNDITIPAAQVVSFQNCDVQFLNNAKITIQGSSELHIVSSHLHSCDNDLWFGIVLNDGAALTSTAGNGASSLIEDAVTAIDVSNYTNSGVSTILNIHNTIFNKNYISINISNYTVIPNPYTPFKIDNSVFTCREIPFTTNTWPNVGSASSATGTAAQLRTAITLTTDLTPPYLSQNGFSITTLKSPYSSQYSHIAISILNAGATSTAYPATNIFTFVTVEIGSPSTASAFTLFDAHENFINIVSSNVKVSNSVFQNTQTYSISNTTATRAAIQYSSGGFHGLLDLSATNSDRGNRFWDCHWAVKSTNATSFKAENAIFRSTHSYTLSTTNPTGKGAIFLGTNRIEDYLIQNNEFTNIADGVIVSIYNILGNPVFSIPGFTLNPKKYLKNLTINTNTISPYINTAFTGTTTNYTNRAITLYSMGEINTPLGNGIAIQSNLIYRAYNGISMNHLVLFYKNMKYAGSPKTISNNNITLEEDNVWNNAQVGIDYVSTHIYTQITASTNNGRESIEANTISLFSGNTSNTGISLIHTFGNISLNLPVPYLICNTVTAAYQGFVFEGPNNPTYWRGNNMSNLARGMSLTNAGIIGVQGTSVAPSDNKWTGSWSGNTGLYVAAGCVASASPLFIKSGTPWTPPSYNGGLPTSNWYNATGGTITAVGLYTCGGSYSQSPRLLPNESDYDSEDLLYIAKASVYEFLHSNDSLRSNDIDFGDFYDGLAGSSIDKFMQIEDALRQSNFASATEILSGINQSGFNSVESNYFTFYTLYIEYATSTDPFSSDNLETLTSLASLCPGTNGLPVYMARALFPIITGELFNSPDGCTSGARPGYFNEEKAKINQHWNVKLFPNPAQNLLSIIFEKESEIVHVSIKDLSGRSVLEKEIKTLNNKADLSLNLINGAYIITLISSQGEQVNRTLLIAK